LDDTHRKADLVSGLFSESEIDADLKLIIERCEATYCVQ